MRVLSRFSNKLFFQILVGIVATVGFPLAYMCTLQYNLFTVAEALVAVVCVVLYSLQKWRLSKVWSVLLLSAHFALWINVGAWATDLLQSRLTLLWPGYNFAFGQHPDMIYPAFGCCSSLLWVLFVTQQRLGIGGRNGNFKQQASRMHANTRTRLFHEAMFSLNVGLTCMIVAFGYGRDSGLESWLYRLNSSINNYLHMAQSDLATNGFVFFIFGLALALCAWALLRLFSNSSVTREILRSVAGFLALAALPAMETNPWSNVGAFRRIVFPLEILFTLYFAFRYLHGQWPQTAWAVCAFFALHFMFWSYEFELYGQMAWTVRYHRFYLFPTIAIAWIVACSSAVLWGLYVAQLRQGIRGPNGFKTVQY